jgi:hypothetical protein
MRFKYVWLLLVISCMFSGDVFAKYKYNISVGAVFQDEGPYLKEWIEYYKLLGVDHFYLYNNHSSDEFRSVLEPYIANGDVDLIEWDLPANNLDEYFIMQNSSIADVVRLAKETSNWLAIIDIDEFIVPLKSKNLKDFLKKYEATGNVGGVCIPWVFFGTSHVKKIPSNKLMIETLVLNAGIPAKGNKSKIWNSGNYKSIVRPKYVDHAVCAHYCEYVNGRRHIMVDLDKAQINHYWTRDEFFFNTVKIPRRERWNQKVESTIRWAETMNKKTSRGKAILRFVPELRKRMGLPLLSFAIGVSGSDVIV